MTFFDKRQSIKTRKHETKGIFADFNVREYSNLQMDTNFERFKEMLALRTMASDELKMKLITQTVICLKEFDDVLRVFRVLRPKPTLCRTRGL